MKYGVTLCAIVDVRVTNIEASSPSEALSKAREVPLDGFLATRPEVRVTEAGEGAELVYTDFANDFMKAFVDELDEDGEPVSDDADVFDFDGTTWSKR
jgi:hypothetical protein